MDVLETYESDQCKLDIVHYGIGNVSVTDIEYADAFQGKFIHWYTKVCFLIITWNCNIYLDNFYKVLLTFQQNSYIWFLFQQ